MTFLEKLDHLMRKTGINKNKLSQLSGVPYTTIDGFYKKGYENTKISTVRKIASAFDVSLDYLVDDEVTDEQYSPQIKSTSSDLSEEAHKVAKEFDLLSEHGKGAVRAILGYEKKSTTKIEPTAQIHTLNKVIYLSHAQDKASAGTGFQLDHDRMDKWMVVYNEETRMADFCVDVVGDSMEPLYHDGDTVLVRQQPSVEIGEIGLFVINDQGFVKRLGEDGLQSINPKYENIHPNEYNLVECMGKVIGLLKSDWIVKV